MNETPSFQRARKPEEIAQRRETLLAAAATLFDETGPAGAGLNAIAAHAGFTKSNVYRYFESREQVLLELFLREMQAMATDLAAHLRTIAPGDIAALADSLVRHFIERPRLGHLTAILSSTLETNVSEPTIIATKRAMGTILGGIATALQTRLPGASVADCGWVVTMLGSLVAGIWPSAHPAPAAANVLARPEFAAHRPDLARDLPRAARALLASIT